MSNCYYHSDSPASAMCIQCGMPICSSCTQMVGAKAACGKCADNVRARFGDTLSSDVTMVAPSNALPLSGSQYYSKPGGSTQTRDYKYSVDALSVGKDIGKDIGRVIGALALGFVVAIVCSCLLDFITNATHFFIGYAYAASGWAVGVTVGSVANRGGVGMAIGACVVLVLGLFIGDIGYSVATTNSAEEAMKVSNFFNVIGLLFTLIGVSACFRLVNRAGQS